MRCSPSCARDPSNARRGDLNVTPSAVSQRVKLLEERVGSLLVKRGQPCEATASGALLCRHTERVQLLEAELGGRMPALPGAPSERRAKLRIAVNDDSMSTWFIDAAADFCIERELMLDLVVDDQDHTAQRIREGDVQGAITTQAEPVPGWRSMKLGRMRYRAVCSPAYFERYFADGLTRDALRRAPCVNFNEKDELQKRFVKRVSRADIEPPAHVVPHGEGFVARVHVRACVGYVSATAHRGATGQWRARGSVARRAPGC